MITFQFENVGATATLCINDVLKMTNVKPVGYWDAVAGKGAQIQVPDGKGGTAFYYYINDAYDSTDTYELDYPTWADDNGDEVVDISMLGIGEGVWFKVAAFAADGDMSINVAGEVFADNELGLSVFGNLGWNMKGHPFPMGFDPRKMDMTGLTPVGYWDAVAGKGAQIQVPDGMGGTAFYYYINDAYDPTDTYEVEYPCWADGYGDEVNFVIAEPMQSFWLMIKDGDTTIPFKK